MAVFFTAIASWVLYLVFKFAVPRHDVWASLFGIAYASCFLLGTGIMVSQVIRILRK